ncbi:hypothetical protein [Nostoc sp.]
MLPDAYFAGHFDGEGCLRMEKHHKIWRLRISVRGAHKPVIEAYKEKFGGSIMPRPDASTNKLLWDWYMVHQGNCLIFINSVLPFSMEKKEQLAIAKEWLNLRMAGNLRHPSQDLRDFGESCSIKMSELKKIC